MRQRIVFLENLLCFRFFKVAKSHPKGDEKRLGLSFALVDIIRMIFFIELRLHEGSDNLALPLIFFNFLR